MDGRYIEGYALEVTYKPASPIGHQGPFHVPSEPIVEYPRTLWSPNSIHSVPNVPTMPTTPPMSMPNMFMSALSSPQMALWPFPSSPVAPPLSQMGMDVPAIQPDSPPMSMPMNAPAPTVAPEPSPPPPYSALPPISEEDHPIDFADAFYSPAPYDPCNLFIKNLDDEVVANQADLEILFSEFGIITSAFLATYGPKDPSHPPVSKGFGFVAFARPDEAELAR
jgi:RNA recognition motif. (a.k.a. RRM, RBD, or RNP domain)